MVQCSQLFSCKKNWKIAWKITPVDNLNKNFKWSVIVSEKISFFQNYKKLWNKWKHAYYREPWGRKSESIHLQRGLSTQKLGNN